MPDPKILNSRDAIIRITSTAICGSDLHLYNGFIPTMEKGDVLGHEFMGEVVETGKAVKNLKVGDRVVVPFPIACGACDVPAGPVLACENSNPNAWMAEKLMGPLAGGIFGYSHMLGGFAGGQAQYARVPFADVGPLKVPDGIPDEQVLFLSDIFPTGYMGAEMCNIQRGDVTRRLGLSSGPGTTSGSPGRTFSRRSRAAASPRSAPRNSGDFAFVELLLSGPMSEVQPETDARGIAEEARARVRFEEEVLGLADQVYRVARRLVSTREEAEDLVQETYARAFRSWRSYTPGTNLRAWLFRILTNLNIDRGRREQRSPATQPLEEGDYFLYNRLEADSGSEDEARIVERLSQDEIVQALAEVPHDFRDVIVLVDIGDFTYQDAAQILDIPIGTVMSRLHRGRRILKKELAEASVGDSG